MTGLSQAALGKLSGSAGNTIARIERGETAMRWDTFERIMDALGQPPAFFFSDQPPVMLKAAEPEKPSLTVEALAKNNEQLVKIIAQQEQRIQELEARIRALEAAPTGDSDVKRELLAALAAIDDNEASVLLNTARDLAADHAERGQSVIKNRKTSS